MWPRDVGQSTAPQPPVPAPAPRDAPTGIMMGVGVAMLVALSIIGVQLGRKDRADHPERAAAASKPVATAAAPAAPPEATTTLPAASAAPQLSIELDDSETVPVIPANKLPDVAPGPAAVDTAMHRNTAVPPNPY